MRLTSGNTQFKRESREQKQRSNYRFILRTKGQRGKNLAFDNDLLRQLSARHRFYYGTFCSLTSFLCNIITDVVRIFVSRLTDRLSSSALCLLCRKRFCFIRHCICTRLDILVALSPLPRLNNNKVSDIRHEVDVIKHCY